MKAIILTGISAVAVTVAAVEASALTVSPEFNSLLYPHLAELNQSQTVETLSVADGVTRLPASAYKTAKVHFLVNNDGDTYFSEDKQNFIMSGNELRTRCLKLGYTVTSCKLNQYPFGLCPYRNDFFLTCCDNDYAYSKAECSYPRTISTNSCGGKYKCYCDTKLYPKTSCTDPYEPYDKCVDDSGIHYAECRCPVNWIVCDSSINQTGQGPGCTYKGVHTFASCNCKAGYNLTCDDYGPKTPTDYCFLKGTKYYKTCKTGQEVCEGLGFKHHSGSPCSADEVIDSYCPRDGNYYSCKIDPTKYCKNHGYSQAACGKYEEVSSETCPHDSSYKKCVKTCKSRIYADYPNYNFDGERSSNGGTMVYTKNVVDNNFSGTSNSYYKSGYTFKDVYSECQNIAKPTVTVNTSGSNVSILSGVDVSDINLAINLSNGSDYNMSLEKLTTLTNTTLTTNYATKLSVNKTTLILNGGSDLSDNKLQLDVNGSPNAGVADSFLNIPGTAKLGNVHLFERAKLYVTDTSGNSSAKGVWIGDKCKKASAHCIPVVTEDSSYKITNMDWKDSSREGYGNRGVLELGRNAKFKVNGTIVMTVYWEDSAISRSGGPALSLGSNSQLIAKHILNHKSEQFIGGNAIVCQNDYWIARDSGDHYGKIKFGSKAKLLNRGGSRFYYDTTATMTDNCTGANQCGDPKVKEIVGKFVKNNMIMSGQLRHDKWAVSVNWNGGADTTGAWNTYCKDWYYK